MLIQYIVVTIDDNTQIGKFINIIMRHNNNNDIVAGMQEAYQLPTWGLSYKLMRIRR